MTPPNTEPARDRLQDLHVYEIIGEVILRRSGFSSPIMLCKVVRTRVAFIKPDRGGFLVTIADIVSGYQFSYLQTWFDNWTDEDNVRDDDRQSGRSVDVAFRVQDFERILIDKHHRDIVAVRVNDRWIPVDAEKSHDNGATR